MLSELLVADTSEVAASFLGCEPAYRGQAKVLWDACAELAFVRDPDGYLVEIVPINPRVDFVREHQKLHVYCGREARSKANQMLELTKAVLSQVQYRLTYAIYVDHVLLKSV